MALRVQLYQSLRQDIDSELDAEFDTELEALKKELEKKFEDKRRKAIEALNEAWPKMGGSEKDLALFTTEAQEPFITETTRTDAEEIEPTSNGSSVGRTIPMVTLREEAWKVLQDPEIDIVTQPDIRERILDKYPDAKVQSVRSVISMYLNTLAKQGDIELVEQGKAGSASKYRAKKRNEEEVGLLGP